MLMPKRVKYRKSHRGRMKGRAKGGSTIAFGQYGLQALEPHWITGQQIESARARDFKISEKRRQALGAHISG